MAKDTKTLNVHPDNEVAAVDFFQNFGWQLFGARTQEVKNTSSHLKGSMWTGDILQVTEREHYIKLTFQRDSTMPNYSRLVQLENEYNAVYSPSEPRKISWIIAGVLAAFVVFAFFEAVNAPPHRMGASMGVFLIAAVPVVAFYTFRIRSYRRKLNDYSNAEAIETEQKQKILSECQRLI